MKRESSPLQLAIKAGATVSAGDRINKHPPTITFTQHQFGRFIMLLLKERGGNS